MNYSAQLVVSVVGNELTLSNIKYMQDITQEICTNTTEGREVQLEDKRDSNKYWVGRMKDGRCWMLQNLALDLTTSGLKASDTDITADWNSSSTYPPVATKAVVTSNSTSQTTTQSWNLGKWVLATPFLTTSCGTTGVTTLTKCVKVGFVDVSSSSFQPTYTATTRSWDGANSNSSTLVTVNCTSWSGSGTSKTCTAGTYDPHYLVGNWYSWNAATAGTGGKTTSAVASGSICPKGWELPYVIPSGGLITIGTKEFGTLLAAYGVESKLSGTVDGVTYNVAGTPLRFVRSGSVSAAYSYVDGAGQYGRYWSSTASSSSDNAYRLLFGASSVNTADSVGRRSGMSVRCVAEYDYADRYPSIHSN